MKIRALRTFTVFDGTQIHVFNGGKDGEPGDAHSVNSELGALCLATGNAEVVGARPQLDHDHDGSAGGSEPHEPPALTGKNKAALLDIAADEGVIVPDDATNKEIVAAIEAARGEPGEDEDEIPPA